MMRALRFLFGARSRRLIHRAKRDRLAMELLEDRRLLAVTPYYPPSMMLSHGAEFLTGPNDGQPLDIALSYLDQHAHELRLTPEDLRGYDVTDQYTDTDTGIAHLYFEQTVNGLEVRNANLGIHLSASGEVIAVSSSFIPGLSAIHSAQPGAPRLDAVDAAMRASEELELSLANGPIYVSSSASETVPSFVLDVPGLSLDDIPAKLHYVPTEDGDTRLAWQLVVRTPDGEHWYDLSIDADAGTVLAQVDWVEDATYRVLPLPLDSPDDGPFQVVSDPALAAINASPFGWHDTDGVAGAESTLTIGNNVDAHLDRDGNNVADPASRPDGGAGLDFNIAFDPAQSPLANAGAAVTNLFYWNNVLHDVHYQYGFTSAAGNFQSNTYSQGGLGNDAVQADAQDNAAGGSANNANFATPPDGTAPRMQMFEFTSTNPRRDSDMDAAIIVHEYGHGVSNRLTGGPSNSSALNALQSGGMGEGWSDWWSLMFRQKSAGDTTQARGVGMYVIGQSQSGLGIRDYRYDFDIANQSFESFVNFSQSTQVHDVGTRWASTLWDLNHLLIEKYGFEPDIYNSSSAAGNIRALRLVMDGLKLQPANPSFLQARDAILAADTALHGGANHLEIWTAFARRGLGFDAATASSSSALLVTSFELPPQFRPFQVLSTVPAVGSSVSIAPTVFDVTFNLPYLASSVDAADFSVNGIPASSVTLTDVDTVSFGYAATPVTAQGQQSMSLAADSILQASDSSNILAFNGAFRFDITPLQIVSVTPPNNGRLTLPGPFNFDFNFNEPVAASSISLADLTLNVGAVVGAEALDSDTVRYTISGIPTETSLAVNLAAGALTDGFGNPNSAAYSSNHVVDVGTVPIRLPLEAILPFGSLVFDRTLSGTISAADSDSFTLDADPNQTLTIIVTPTVPALQPRVELFDPNNVSLGFRAATSAGKAAVMQTIPLTIAGNYKFTVSSLGNTLGNYTVRVLLNAAFESESALGGNSNDTLATAQNINGSFLSLQTPFSVGRRAAVQGRLGNQTVHSVNFDAGLLPTSISIASFTDTGLPDPQGRIRVKIPDGTGNTSPFALMMDRAVSGLNTLNEAIWTVDLTGLTTAQLSFSHVSIGDETHGLPTSFVGHANGDGVAISADGINWYTILSAPTNSAWTPFSVDLVAAAATGGMVLGPNFKIKFQQFDNFPLLSDGRGYDNFLITGGAETDWYRLDLSADDRTTFATKSLSGGNATVDLFNAVGTALASGTAGADNVDRMISRFVIPSSGVYYARITGSRSLDYQFVVTQQSDFDTEGNDSFETAQNITGAQGVLGSLKGSVNNSDIESFDGGPSDLSRYTFTSSHFASVTAEAAHDGSFGLHLGTGQTNWMYRNDPAVQVQQGDVISYWVRTTTARVYLGFGASPSGTLSLVLGGNTNSFIIQRNPAFGFEIIGTVPQVWGVDKWYRCEVDWKVGGGIVGRLFDSDGTTLLNTVTATETTIASGGIAFRSFSTPVFIDSVRIVNAATSSGSNDDWYTIQVANPGDQLRLETKTPNNARSESEGVLDPHLELYSPSGQLLDTGTNLPDGRNESLQLLNAPVAGAYRIRLSAQGTSIGDYYLGVTNSGMLTLSSNALPENSALGTKVGDLKTDAVGTIGALDYALVPGEGDADNAAFSLVGNELRTNVPLDFESQSSYSIRLRTSDQASFVFERSFTIHVANISEASVVNRQLFYNRALSAVFGDGTGNPASAIDPSKIALLPNQSASYDNYSNYVHGLNGLVVDIAGQTSAAASDFQFDVWNGIDGGGFVPTAATPTIAVLPGEGLGGSKRVKIEFADGAIRNTWLRVTLLANASTDIADNDVFYFGTAVADVNIGNLGTPITVRTNATDTAAIRSLLNQSPESDSVGISNIYDLDKDGRVNSTDTAIVRQNQANDRLRYFTAPASGQTTAVPSSAKKLDQAGAWRGTSVADVWNWGLHFE